MKLRLTCLLPFIIASTSNIYAEAILTASNNNIFLAPIMGLGSPTGTYTRSKNNTQFAGSSAVGGNAFLGGGLIGYEYNFEQITVIGDINLLYNSYDNNIRIGANNSGVRDSVVSVKNHFIYGADLKLGIHCDNSMPYLLAGVNAGKWT